LKGKDRTSRHYQYLKKKEKMVEENGELRGEKGGMGVLRGSSSYRKAGHPSARQGKKKENLRKQGEKKKTQYGNSRAVY